MVWRQLSKDEDPKEIKISLNELASRVGMSSPGTTKAVFLAWEKAAGKEVASHSQPLSFIDGVLTVVVSDTRWANQLRWMSPEITKRLIELNPSIEMEKIDIRLDLDLGRK